jgi:hypothetical protein
LANLVTQRHLLGLQQRHRILNHAQFVEQAPQLGAHQLVHGQLLSVVWLGYF